MRWFDKAGLVALTVCVLVMAHASVASAAWIDLLYFIRYR